MDEKMGRKPHRSKDYETKRLHIRELELLHRAKNKEGIHNE